MSQIEYLESQIEYLVSLLTERQLAEFEKFLEQHPYQ